MTIKEYLSKLKSKLVTATAEEKPAIEAQIAELSTIDDPTPVPAPVPGAGQPLNGDISAVIEAAVKRGNAGLQEQVNGLADALAKEQEARKSATDALQQERTAKLEKETETLVADAVAKGKIPNDPAKIELWKTNLKKDFEGYKAVLDDLTGNSAVNKPGTPPAAGAAGAQGGTTPKQYTDKFSRSIPPEVMKSVEESLAA